MTREDQESTAPIHRDALLGLLELTRADARPAAKSRTKRKRAQTCSEIAALLPPRSERVTRPPPLALAKPPTSAAPEPVAVPEVRTAEPAPRIEPTPAPTPAPAHVPSRLRFVAKILASIAATFLAGLCAGYMCL